MKRYYGDTEAEKQTYRMAAKIQKVYSEAASDVRKKLEQYLKTKERLEKQKREDLNSGKITQKQYDTWLRGAVFRGDLWKRKLSQIEDEVYKADKTAVAIINDAKKAIFINSANYEGYNLEKGLKASFGFDLYDSATVTRLLKKDPMVLPKSMVRKGKSNEYFQKNVASAITQGIIQGESLDKIAKRISEKTGNASKNAALTQARTAMTGAQNAGRIEAMHDAQSKGIKVQKVWIATLDQHTRDTHRDLDGQIVDVDKPFVIDGMEIMYPGDPEADPSLVINCRCTIGYHYPEYASDHKRLVNDAEDEEGKRTLEYVNNMTYREWEEMKKGEVEAPNVPVAKVIEYGNLFPDEVGQITRDTLDDLNREYPISRELDYVGDVRTHRGLDPEVDIFDLHHEYPNLSTCGAQYLKYGADGKSGPCIEIHKESYSTQKLQDEFDSRYALRLNYGDPMQPPKPQDAFYTASDTFEGTIRHEYGHALSDDKGVFSGGQDNSFRRWQLEYWERHRTDLLAISQYAASHPDEMFAEAFVQAQDTRHPDTLAYKLSREIMDAFERYTRGESL